ncbi:hypothetical protein D9M68_601280 [compost metagenome]
MSPEAVVQHVRNHRQEIAHGVLHAADVGLLNRIAVGAEATSEFGLRQRLATLLLVEFAGFFDTERAFHEGQATMQFVFRQVAGQGNDFAAFGPGTEQTGNAEEALVLGLGPQLAQDGESRITAIADDVVLSTGSSSD